MSIVIVNWNLKHDTENCICSLVRAGAHLDQIIVVDNGSVDDSPGHLRAVFGDGLRIVELAQNLGLAGAANTGIRRACEEGAEWILLLNNDTWVADNFFDILWNAVNKYPQYTVFGPAIFYADSPELIWYLGDRLVPGTMLTIQKYRNKALPAGLPDVIPVDFLSGCAMLVKCSAFKEIGLLDASLFMYGEEVDWCWRARRAGHRFAVVPTAFMWHKVSASSKGTSTLHTFLRIRNQIWGYRRYGNTLHKVLLFPFTLFRVFILSLKFLISNHLMLFRSAWGGWIAGWWHTIPPVTEYSQQ